MERRNWKVETTLIAYRHAGNKAARAMREYSRQQAALRWARERGVCIINEPAAGALFRLAGRFLWVHPLPPWQNRMCSFRGARAPLMPRILNYSTAAHTHGATTPRNSSVIDFTLHPRPCISVSLLVSASFSFCLARFFFYFSQRGRYRLSKPS